MAIVELLSEHLNGGRGVLNSLLALIHNFLQTLEGFTLIAMHGSHLLL